MKNSNSANRLSTNLFTIEKVQSTFDSSYQQKHLKKDKEYKLNEGIPRWMQSG